MQIIMLIATFALIIMMSIMKLAAICALIAFGIYTINYFVMRHSVEYYSDTSLRIDIKEYFNGPIKAWGIVQDFRGRVVTRFDINMVGKWKGDIGILTEHFSYYDGKKIDRSWTIKKIGDDSYEGTASDVIGKAPGNTKGSAARWSYIMDLPVGNTTYHIKFEDWMWVMNDGVIINRSYLKKFGITVAELTIFLQKQKS